MDKLESEITLSKDIANSENDKVESISDLSHCMTLEDVNTTLDELAKVSNKSIAHALKAQIQVIKYISAPSLFGSTFDMFFKHLKEALSNANQESSIELQNHAALMLNNFIFFMKAKVEWEIAVNRKEYDNLLEEASKELAENIINISSMAAGDISTPETSGINVAQLVTVLGTSKDVKDNLIQKAVRWYRKDKRTKEKQRDFCETIDRLAEKLNTNYEVIGRNDLIAGIFQNYRKDLLTYHAENLEKEVSRLNRKNWIFLSTVFSIGAGIGVMVWLIRWIISWFSNYPEGWATQQWIWTGIIVGGVTMLSLIIKAIKIFTIKQKIRCILQDKVIYYDELIEKFKE